MAATGVARSLVLNTGARIPTIGLGTWKSAPSAAGQALKFAIEAGLRHIDAAQVYNNEAECGQALADVFGSGVVTREELFITSKVFNYYHDLRTPEQIAAGVPSPPVLSLERSLADLRLDYLDLLLIHWPIAFAVDPANPPNPMRLPTGQPHPDLGARFEFKATWRALEDLVLAGDLRVRAIGVSNFSVAQLTELLADARVVPAVNQIECHPLLPQDELRAFCAAKGIAVVAYSPLGSPDSYSGSRPDAPTLLRAPLVGEIATELGVSPAQVLIRWSLQQGNAVIPKSVTRERIVQNADVFGFELTPTHMAALATLACGHRFGQGWMPGHFMPQAS